MPNFTKLSEKIVIAIAFGTAFVILMYVVGILLMILHERTGL